MRMGRLLEAGAQAIMYPRCESAEEAAEVVRWAKFAPQGERGVDGANGDNPYCAMPMPQYLKLANEHTLLITQLESPRALDNADAIARVGLSSISDRIAGELSTKELRLMELARALAGQPKILLLDETLAGLGHDEADEVVAVIQRLTRDNMTVAIIEHTMQAMVRLVDNFLVLDHGAVLVEGKPETVTRDTRVIEAYLGKKWVAHAAH